MLRFGGCRDMPFRGKFDDKRRSNKMEHLKRDEDPSYMKGITLERSPINRGKRVLTDVCCDHESSASCSNMVLLAKHTPRILE